MHQIVVLGGFLICGFEPRQAPFDNIPAVNRTDQMWAFQAHQTGSTPVPSACECRRSSIGRTPACQAGGCGIVARRLLGVMAILWSVEGFGFLNQFCLNQMVFGCKTLQNVRVV